MSKYGFCIANAMRYYGCGFLRAEVYGIYLNVSMVNPSFLKGLVFTESSGSPAPHLSLNMCIDRLGNWGWDSQLLTESDDGTAKEVALMAFALCLNVSLE